MTVLILLPPLVVFGLSMILGATFGDPLPIRWWLLRLGALPLIFFIIAAYISSVPTPLPVNYDPEVHGNPGRMDFFAAIFWGFVAPTAYLILALPISIAYGIWIKHKGQQ